MSEENKPDLEKVQLTEQTRAIINRKENSVKIVTKGEKTAQDNLEMLEFFSQENKIPIFKGTVDHAYESDFLGYKDHCPNCDTPTQQMMSNFGYGTQDASRILTAPAGHFCSNCPTVIIDDDLMKSFIDKKFEYCGVFSVESGYEDNKELLQTLNGEKPVFILDPTKTNIYGIQQSVHQSPDDYIRLIKVSEEKKRQLNIKQQKKKKSNKRKNKAAKKARKNNRRK